LDEFVTFFNRESRRLQAAAVEPEYSSSRMRFMSHTVWLMKRIREEEYSGSTAAACIPGQPYV